MADSGPLTHTTLVFYPQINLDGVTGPVKFSDDGERTGVELEILNLRNDSFVKVSSTVDYCHSLLSMWALRFKAKTNLVYV